MANNHRAEMARLLQGEGLVKAPGVYDGLSALLVEQAGFDCAFLSGGSLSFARYGRPDMGLVCANEVAQTVSILRDRVELPLIVDMDTGFGNALNVQRTVRDFERAGASALQMEDQVLPKRCGHMAGKRVISTQEMVGKIKAALDARVDQQTAIIARTDALAVNGIEDAMARAQCYLEAGADALFIEAPRSTADLEHIGRTFGTRTALVHNLVEGGGSPVTDPETLRALGFRIALYPVALLHRFVPAAQQVLEALKATGSTDQAGENMFELADMNSLLGADALLSSGRAYDET